MTLKEKKDLLDLIKSIDIQEMAVPEGAKRKWYKFGAYDGLRMASEAVMNYQPEKKTKNAK